MNRPFVPVKICGLTREADVDAAVAAGAQALGFVLYPASPRAVTAQRAGELARRLPAFVTPVLLWVNASADEVQAGCDLVPGAWLQFQGELVGQGKDAARQALVEKPDLARKIHEAIIAKRTAPAPAAQP